MHFKLQINMDNAAFENSEELPALVESVLESLRNGYGSGDGSAIQDSNGNTVGKWEVSE